MAFAMHAGKAKSQGSSSDSEASSSSTEIDSGSECEDDAMEDQSVMPLYACTYHAHMLSHADSFHAQRCLLKSLLQICQQMQHHSLWSDHSLWSQLQARLHLQAASYMKTLYMQAPMCARANECRCQPLHTATCGCKHLDAFSCMCVFYISCMHTCCIFSGIPPKELPSTEKLVRSLQFEEEDPKVTLLRELAELEELLAKRLADKIENEKVGRTVKRVDVKEPMEELAVKSPAMVYPPGVSQGLRFVFAPMHDNHMYCTFLFEMTSLCFCHGMHCILRP